MEKKYFTDEFDQRERERKSHGTKKNTKMENEFYVKIHTESKRNFFSAITRSITDSFVASKCEKLCKLLT